MKIKIGNETLELNKVDIPSFKINNYEERAKDTFYVLKHKKWIEINFKDIKKNDIIVRKSCKYVYFLVSQEPNFDEGLNDFALCVNIIEKVDTEFNWSL